MENQQKIEYKNHQEGEVNGNDTAGKQVDLEMNFHDSGVMCAGVTTTWTHNGQQNRGPAWECVALCASVY